MRTARRAGIRTAKRTGTAAWSLITAVLFLLLPALYLLLQRSTVTPVPEPPLPAEEQATAAYSNAYDDLRGTVPAAGADWDGDLTAGLYTVGRICPRAPTPSSVPRAIHPLTCTSSAMRTVLKSTRICPLTAMTPSTVSGTMFRCRQAPCCF